MTVRRAASLSIRLEVRDQTRIVVQDEQGVVRVNITTEFSRAQFQDICTPLQNDFNFFRSELSIPDQTSIKKVTQVLLRMQKRGRNILYDLFKGEIEELRRTVDLCQQACPSWRKPGWEPTALMPPLITVHIRDGLGIPIEILPFMELRTPREYEGDLARVASSFLGFSAIVKREISRRPIHSTTLRLDNEPRLPIKIFISRDLGGALQDDRYLRTISDIDLDTAWPPPTPPAQDQFCAELARHLWRASETIAGQPRTPPFQIYHFCCHCDTTRQSSMEYTIEFYTRLLQRKREVRLEDLRDELLYLREGRSEEISRPLIFMNACGSTGLNPNGASSFPDLFLNNDLGFLGFLATETTVPDGFASLFTKIFYENILRALPVGQALYATRWQILQSRRNPLGIIYTLYAEPEIQVRKPRLCASFTNGTGSSIVPEMTD